ncbi:hypothetical protein CF386_07155 [Paraphotobacterium marinum]|uniref:HMA domain-containing protein n=1 Tax=Paraphotobacterium marinum TaxID=1755811 RepID=A0A220VEJ5_9GAMM|nr:heavy metal translocating P-type ATPase [Paraphotobacterium marinum]ASK78787.1 hypothetical protein CF386_07155 [Paraphotobacterium marinum]
MCKQECFHCGETIKNKELFLEINNKQEVFCCIGCLSIANILKENNLLSFYQFRKDKNQTQIIPENLKVFDHENVQKKYTSSTKVNTNEITLVISNISCAACSWVIEQSLERANGIISVKVNSQSSRAHIHWNPTELKLSDILFKIHQLGFKGVPYNKTNEEENFIQEQKKLIKKIGISSICSMQVMMFTIILYYEFFNFIESTYIQIFRWLCFIFCLPVITYCASEFYKNTYKGFKLKMINMDCTISVAIIALFFSSFYYTITMTHEVYYESICMFVTIILSCKYFQKTTLHKTFFKTQYSSDLPLTVKNTNNEIILTDELKVGDEIIVPAGHIIGADGQVSSGVSSVNESILTGEFKPQKKTKKDSVFAGTKNIDSEIIVTVGKIPSEFYINQISSINEKALMHKPHILLWAEKTSQYFLLFIFTLSFLCYLFWAGANTNQALYFSITVLVASCPCALTLSIPAAVASLLFRLNREGFFIKKGSIIEIIPKIKTIYFDKTGTLSKGDFSLIKVKLYKGFHQFDKNKILAICASLEKNSTHPIGKPFLKYVDEKVNVSSVKVFASKGVVGRFNSDTYKIGKIDFVEQSTSKKNDLNYNVFLSKNNKIIAAFLLQDKLRNDTASVLSFFAKLKKKVIILTGDTQKNTQTLLKELPINNICADMTAHQKHEVIKKNKNEIMMSVGDGANDANFLAESYLSVAMNQSANITKQSADIILAKDNISLIKKLFQYTTIANLIIKQNIIISFFYNIVMIPLAFFGFLSPLIAAAGMSLSSIVVILNSLRLTKKRSFL